MCICEVEASDPKALVPIVDLDPRALCEAPSCPLNGQEILERERERERERQRETERERDRDRDRPNRE